MPKAPPKHANAVHRARKKLVEADRNADKAKRYGRDWQALRKAYMAQHPLCELC